MMKKTMSQAFLRARFCSQCGTQLVARIAALDGSAICLKCRAIEYLPVEKRPLLKLLRKLGEKWADVPEDASGYASEDFIDEFIRQLETATARLLADFYGLSEDVAIEQVQQSDRTFDEWARIIKTGNFPPIEPTFEENVNEKIENVADAILSLQTFTRKPVSRLIRKHIIWLCEDMLELNECCVKDARRGELEWTQDDFEYEQKESKTLAQIESKLEQVPNGGSVQFTKEEIDALKECNEMDLNDGKQIRGHNFRSIAFKEWLRRE